MSDRSSLPGAALRACAVASALALVLLAGLPGPSARSAANVKGSLAERTGRIEVNAMEYPWSAIGRVNAGGRGHCTGFLVGERAVLTAAHCLYDRKEGRWRGPGELHFVAGYQRDTYLIHSPVAGYARAAKFAPGAPPSARGAMSDWAVLRLAEPIGRRAGWLALGEVSDELLARVERGEARLLQAGYRQGWTHIMSVSLDCEPEGTFADRLGIAHHCDLAKGDSGSPLLALHEGEISAVGLHVVDAQTKRGKLAGALSLSAFHPARGDREAVRAIGDSGAIWGQGRPPEQGGPALTLPVKTIERLLVELGHLDRGESGHDAARQAAIAAFQDRIGVPATGQPSLTLLGRLIEATD